MCKKYVTLNYTNDAFTDLSNRRINSLYELGMETETTFELYDVLQAYNLWLSGISTFEEQGQLFVTVKKENYKICDASDLWIPDFKFGGKPPVKKTCTLENKFQIDELDRLSNKVLKRRSLVDVIAENDLYVELFSYASERLVVRRKSEVTIWDYETHPEKFIF